MACPRVSGWGTEPRTDRDSVAGPCRSAQPEAGTRCEGPNYQGADRDESHVCDCFKNRFWGCPSYHAVDPLGGLYAHGRMNARSFLRPPVCKVSTLSFHASRVNRMNFCMHRRRNTRMLRELLRVSGLLE